MRCEKVHQESSVGVKRKKLTAHAYKSLRRKHNNNKVPGHSEDSRTSSVGGEIMGNSAIVSSRCSLAKIAETTPQSTECGNCSLLGTCILCSKEKRINYNSPEKELCTCNAVMQNDLDHSSICKDTVDQRSAEKCHCRNLLKETDSGRKMEDNGPMCFVCNKDGELLCCEGKECKIRYHLSCLDPLLPDDLPGVSHCPGCTSKKLELGVYSVSEGVESIWDVREVEILNAKGIKQRQYLVKYQGIAHIHNHWIPANNLSLLNQSLVSNFSTKDERWSVDWTVPHRLLRKRPILDKYHTEPTADISETYEWLVKWKGLDYNHATWEVDSSHFLSLDQDFMTEYEIRRIKAKREVEKGYFVELSELPGSESDVSNRFLLKNVNKLRECWYKNQNAAVFDNQDRAMTLVFFIQSLAEFCHPFLVVASSESLSKWEAEFARLAPSVDVVVYNGNIDTRKGIRASEFYEEGGCVMLQVLLSSPEAVSEDIEMLSCIKWQSIVIDESPHSRTSTDLEQIKFLTTDSRILLLSSQIKNTTSEYLSILSLLDSEQEYNKLRALSSGKNENLAKMKERLSRFIAYGSTSEVSKFLEYWVPIQISNHQLEQYCSTLISNSIHLCSSSRNDKFGALQDILLTVRKCCDHPYLVDSSIQQQMIYEKHPEAEVLDVGIKACGKLQLLEMMLTQIKAQELNVLIIFQSAGSGGSQIGYILCDFLVDKFGPNSYELVFGGTPPSTRQAAFNRFNKRNEKFILLLEKSACASSIKLSSLDAIILYNSDWNPENDLKALQRLSYDLAVHRQIKVFRLYSSCTVEERALILAKTNLNFDNNLQASSRSLTDSLLMWGASCLFSRLDDYHSERSSDLNSNYGQLLLNELSEEFNHILSECGEISESVHVISKVKLDVASYSADIQMLGEAKVQLTDVEEPHVFWKKLLDNRISPQWIHIMEKSPRSRKRLHYMGVSLVKSDAGQKRRRVLIEDVYQASAQVEIQENQETDQVSSSEGVPSRAIASSSSSQSSLRVRSTCIDNRDDMSGPRTTSPEFIKCGSEEINAASDEQKSIHSSLHEETQRLCQTLELSDDVTQTLRRFLDYVILNHPICRDTPTIMQAYQISLLWISASIAKQEVDQTESLILAKQSLNYQCTEEQVRSVYSKMLDLMKMYLHNCSLNSTNSGADCSVAEENTKDKTITACEQTPPSSSVAPKNTKLNIEENSSNVEQHYDKVNHIQRECDKRMRKLIQKQKRETQEVYRIWEVKKLKLETDHKLAAALIRCIYAEGSARVVNVKLLDAKFSVEMEENNLLKDVELKDLEAKQLDARNEESKKASHWIAEVKACINQLKLTGNIICADMPASGEGVPNEMGQFEQNKEVPFDMPENVPCGISEDVDYPEGIISASSTGCDKGDIIVFPLGRQISEEPSEQTKSSLHRCDFLPPQVLSEDQIHQSLSSKLPDQGAPVVDDPKTFQFEVSASRTFDSVKISQSKCKLQDRGAPTPVIDDHGTLQIEGTNPAQGDIVTPLQSNIAVNVSNNASPSQNQSTAIEIEIQSHDSGPETEMLGHESDALTGANLEMQKNAEPVVATVEHSNDAILRQLGMDLGHELAYGDSPLLFSNPLQNELEHIHKETSVDVNVSNNSSLGEIQSMAIEVEIQSHDSGLETEILPHDSDSRTGENLDMQNNAEPVVGTVEHSSEAILLQLGMDLGREVASLSSNPLQNNLEHIHKETSIDVNVSNNASPGEDQSTAIEVDIQNHDFGPETELLPHESDYRTEAYLEMQNNVEPVVATVEHSNEAILLQLGMDLDPEVASWDSLLLSSNPIQNELENIHKEISIVNVSNNTTPGENQATAIEVEIQSHDSGLETEMLPHESEPHIGANLEMQNTAESVVGTVEHSNETILLQLGMDLGREVVSFDSPFLSSKSLQNELNNIHKETEDLKKCHEKMILHLKSECEKKIQETTAQVLKDYKVKFQDAEAEYTSKKNGLDENYKKVFMNKILAKAFSFICKDLQSSGLPGIHQDFPSSFLQQRNQQSLQHSERHLPMPNLQAFRPANPRSRQEIIRAPSPQLQGQEIIHVPSPHLQCLRPAANLRSSQEIIRAPSPHLQGQDILHAPSPHFQGLIPAANLRSSQDTIYASAPQLQAFRPAFPLLIPPHDSHQLLPPWNLPTTSQNRPEYHQRGPLPLRGSPLSEMELLRNVNSRPGGSFFFGPN